MEGRRERTETGGTEPKTKNVSKGALRHKGVSPMNNKKVLLPLILIFPLLVTGQTITVVSPNGGENWTALNYHPIHWNWTGNISYVKIEYSTDGGSTWNVIISNTTNDGCYAWVVSYAPSGNCRVKVTDASNPAVFDVSDSSFTIARPEISLRSPNGSEVWTVGEHHALHWDWTGDFNQATLEYSTDGGGSWAVIAASITNDGSHYWTIPNAPSTNCKVRVKNVSDPSCFDISDGNFIIEHPFIKVKRPNGGETYYANKYAPIHWDWTGGFSNVKLEYSTDGGESWTVITSSTTNDGCYSWHIPNGLSATTCKIRVTNTSDPNSYDISDSNFTVTTTLPPDTIKITSPKNGDQWIVGRHYYITWTTLGSITNVKIEYSTDGGSTWSLITASTSNDGQYEWTIPNTPSTNCKVKISNAANPNVYGESEIFAINKQTITVTSPVAGISWMGGRRYYISWNWTGAFNEVKIEYSTDGGSTWSLVAATADNDGQYEWTIPNTPSTNCKVKISNVANPAAYDESDVFTIAPQQITVTSPRAGDIWIVDRHYYITWNWTGVFSEAKIEYSTDGGSTWNLITASTGNDGYYQWTIPNTPSTNCKVKISNPANSAAYDESDVFEIRQPGAITEGAFNSPPFQPIASIQPNPVKSRVNIRFYLPQETNVDLKVLNSTGEVVKVLINGRHAPGFYRVTWNIDEGLTPTPDGIYFCYFRAGDFLVKEKLTVIH